MSVSKVESRRPPKPWPELIKGIAWSGDVPLQKWMIFYTKVLARFATAGGIKLRVSLQISPDGGISEQKVEEAKAGLRELGMEGEVEKTEYDSAISEVPG